MICLRISLSHTGKCRILIADTDSRRSTNTCGRVTPLALRLACSPFVRDSCMQANQGARGRHPRITTHRMHTRAHKSSCTGGVVWRGRASTACAHEGSHDATSARTTTSTHRRSRFQSRCADYIDGGDSHLTLEGFFHPGAIKTRDATAAVHISTDPVLGTVFACMCCVVWGCIVWCREWHCAPRTPSYVTSVPRPLERWQQQPPPQHSTE